MNTVEDVCKCWRYESPLGEIVLADNNGCLIGAWWSGQKYFASTLHKRAVEWQRTDAINNAIAWLDEYFAGNTPSRLPQIRLEGTPWQQTVWRHLAAIPYGATTTYGAIARAIEVECGKKASAQAVGNAVGRNPVSLFVPCHRVVGADGSLTGYAAGIHIKRALLLIEQR